MGPITKKSSCSLIVALACVAQAKVFDQSVAVVGAHVVTLRDVRMQSTVQALMAKGRIPGGDRPDRETGALEAARRAIITDWLVIDYSSAIQAPVSTKSAAMDQEADRILALDGGKVRQFLEGEAFTRDDVRSVVERKARLEAFVDQQLGFRVSITDEEVREHYEKNRATKFLSKSFEAVEGIAREDLRREKIQAEFARWMEIQTRRTEVTLLPMRQGA